MSLIHLGIALILYYGLHSLLADSEVKLFLCGKLISSRYYRILYNVAALVMLIPVGWIYFSVETQYLFHSPLASYAGMGIVLGGLVLMYLSLRQYDLSEFSGTRQLQEDLNRPENLLQTQGLNARVRHPLYFSGLLILWGYFLSQPSDKFLLVALLSTLYLYIGTRLEEKKLVAEFGESYLKYQREVPMLIPPWF